MTDLIKIQAKSKDFSDLLQQISEGKIPVPNYEEVPDSEIMTLLSYSSTPLSGLCVIWVPDQDPKYLHRPWARYIFFRTQGGAFDGTGYVVWYRGGHGQGAKFAICKHDKIARADANPTRGWHPGSCRHCGLDMTVDSGD